MTPARRIAAEAVGTAFLLADVPGFIVAEFVGAAVATALFRWLVPSLTKDAGAVVVSHSSERKALYER